MAKRKLTIEVFHDGSENKTTKLEVVNTFLDDKQMCYGQMCTGTEILEYSNIFVKPAKDEICAAYYEQDFIDMAEAIAITAERELKRRGFAADKRVRVGATDSDMVIIDHKNKQTVYTRWPWSIYFKAKESVGYAERSMMGNHRGEVCTAFMMEVSPSVRTMGESLLDQITDVAAIQFKQNRSKIDPMFEIFVEKLNKDRESMTQLARTKQPRNYNA